MHAEIAEGRSTGFTRKSVPQSCEITKVEIAIMNQSSNGIAVISLENMTL